MSLVPWTAPLRFFDSFNATEWHDLRSLEAIGPQTVHRRLLPKMPFSYLCLSAAAWFPFLECGKTISRQICQTKLDRATLASLHDTAGEERLSDYVLSGTDQH